MIGVHAIVSSRAALNPSKPLQRQVVSQRKGVAHLLEEIWGADWLPLHIKLDPYNLCIVVEGKPS